MHPHSRFYISTYSDVIRSIITYFVFFIYIYIYIFIIMLLSFDHPAIVLTLYLICLSLINE